MKRVLAVLMVALSLDACGQGSGIGSGGVQHATQQMTLSATWKPADRKIPIEIYYVVAGQRFDVPPQQRSPWNHFVEYIGSGRVEVHALQHGTGDLDVVISIDGKVKQHGHTTRSGGTANAVYDP